jgi:hypothetical protein
MASNVEFVHSDVFDWKPGDRRFDLVVTHFFLDCFTRELIEAIVPRIASAAAPGASWLLADFQVAARGWKRVRSRAILALLYGFFRFVTRLPAKHLTAPDPYLERAGFKLRERKEYDWALLKSDWWVRTG